MTLAEILTNPDYILDAFVAVVTFTAMLTLFGPLLRGKALSQRLQTVANRREAQKSRDALAQKSASSNALRQTDAGLYRKVVDRLRLSKLLEDPKLVARLAHAGFRGPKPLNRFYFFRLVLPLAFGALAALILFLLHGMGLKPIFRTAAILATGMLGFYAPNIYISDVAKKRQLKIARTFPDALDLLLICVEAGMSIEAAITRVAREIGETSMELAEELTLLVAELSYLPERRMAYDGLAKRNNNAGIKSVVMAMIQAERYGTPLGAALRATSSENRDLRLAAAEKKAAALPAKLTVPMILLFLPVLFICILGPAIINITKTMGPGGSDASS